MVERGAAPNDGELAADHDFDAEPDGDVLQRLLGTECGGARLAEGEARLAVDLARLGRRRAAELRVLAVDRHGVHAATIGHGASSVTTTCTGGALSLFAGWCSRAPATVSLPASS